MKKNNSLAVVALLTAAMVWGLIWFPYRALETGGVGGAAATLLTYFLALLPGLLWLRGRSAAIARSGWLLAAMALAAGWCNLAYVLGTLHGEVMQVMLLFYMAPLWTVIFARILLGEKPGAAGYFVIALSLGGATIMLGREGLGLPLPHSGAEWLGLSSGMAFALTNVLSRRARDVDLAIRSLSVWAGVALVALPVMLLTEDPMRSLRALDADAWLLVVLLAVVIFSVNLVVQYGLANTGANQAIVIFLSELVFAAVGSYVLASETMTWRQWLGGAMVVAAMLYSGRLQQAAEGSAHA
ncbi:MAG TPA: DMT family transporter [Burkholderiales bacterium]|jgi:drug/metabolite transporter (DMT)-like permease|nr:DMT family transporter [Burkholderiales bacterium]